MYDIYYASFGIVFGHYIFATVKNFLYKKIIIEIMRKLSQTKPKFHRMNKQKKHIFFSKPSHTHLIFPSGK